MRRLAAKTAPHERRRATSDSGSRWKSVFRFVMQGSIAETQWRRTSSRTPRVSTRTPAKAEFYVQQITNRWRRRTSFSQSGSLREDAGVKRRQSRSRHEDAGGKIRAGKGTLRIRQSDPAQFGRANLATRGK